jgi:hypothetical protein
MPSLFRCLKQKKIAFASSTAKCFFKLSPLLIPTNFGRSELIASFSSIFNNLAIKGFIFIILSKKEYFL